MFCFEYKTVWIALKFNYINFIVNRKFAFLNLIMGEYEKPTISGFIEGGAYIKSCSILTQTPIISQESSNGIGL